MSLEGRTEKRISMAIPLYLRGVEGIPPAERAVTVNLSSRGVQVLSRRRREPGAELHIVSVGGNPLLQTRVVYCRAVDGEHFSVGLEFRSGANNWRKALG